MANNLSSLVAFLLLLTFQEMVILPGDALDVGQSVGKCFTEWCRRRWLNGRSPTTQMDGNLTMAAKEGQVIPVHTKEEWTHNFQKGIDSKNLVVVYFTTSSCKPCRRIAPILDEIAEKKPHVTFLKVDIEELQTVADQHRVLFTPTFVFFKEGKEVDRIMGAKKEDLRLKVTKHDVTLV